MNSLSRFWALVSDTSDPAACWNWIGSTRSGYGRLCRSGRYYSAHRFSYELLIGLIPENTDLDHLCRNRACVNPAHLEPVSRRENVLRGTGMAAKNAVKTACPKGHPFTEVDHPRRLRICRTCARAAVRETYWKHAPGMRLTDEEVREARRLFAAGAVRVSALAQQFGLSGAVMGKLVRGSIYTSVH